MSGERAAGGEVPAKSQYWAWSTGRLSLDGEERGVAAAVFIGNKLDGEAGIGEGDLRQLNDVGGVLR